MADLIDRQAAIDALNEEYHGMISDESMKIYKIIEWLGDLPSAQPTQTNAPNALKSLDCISRQAAIDAIGRDPMGGLNYARILKDLPTAEPKTGHWIKISPAGIYECSQCGQNVMTGDIEVYAYCHYCGAYMKEESNETD